MVIIVLINFSKWQTAPALLRSNPIITLRLGLQNQSNYIVVFGGMRWARLYLGIIWKGRLTLKFKEETYESGYYTRGRGVNLTAQTHIVKNRLTVSTGTSLQNIFSTYRLIYRRVYEKNKKMERYKIILSSWPFGYTHAWQTTTRWLVLISVYKYIYNLYTNTTRPCYSCRHIDKYVCNIMYIPRWPRRIDNPRELIRADT